MDVCMNNTEYQGRGKLILNPEKIANVAKAAEIDPKIVSKNLFIQTAFNSQHQLHVANEIAQLLEDNSDIELIVINNRTILFKDSNISSP